MDSWYVPITLLPSVGFFIVATTSVANALSAEIARLLELDDASDRNILSKKIKQLRRVNIALVVLYLSGVFFAIAGLLAGLEFSFMVAIESLITLLICIGIGAVVLALIILMIYSIRSFRIKEEQFNKK